MCCMRNACCARAMVDAGTIALQGRLKLMARNSLYWKLWLETALAANAAATTISLRTIGLQASFLAGDPTGGREGRRMTLEKPVAAGEAYLAASSAIFRFWTGAMLSPAGRTPHAVTDAAFRILRAGSRPGFRKVRANARRLSRR